MPPARNVRRGPSPLLIVMLVVLTLLFGTGGTIGGLYYAGVDLPFLKHQEDHTGQVAVPAVAVPVPANTRITIAHLVDPQTKQMKWRYLPPKAVERLNVFQTPDEILGRVTRREKMLGMTFTEADFHPKGTRPGLVAAIPSGKRALTIDAGKIQGIHNLKPGDRLDILASRPVDLQKVMSQSRQQSGNSGGTAGLHAGVIAQQKAAAVRVLVHYGAIVQPVTTRVVPVSSSSLTQGMVNKTKPVQEVVVAVEPEEIAPLTEAIAVEANIFCVARSGLPDDPGSDSVTPGGANPADAFHTVESIVAGKRQVSYVPRPSALAGGPKPDDRTGK